MKAIVVAMDRNRGIGANGTLLWMRDLPADLAHFKKLTTGGSIIMGRKTFEFDIKKPLPNRENIVVSRHPTGVKGVLTAVSLDSAYALARYPVFVIGGGQIFEQAIRDVDRLYVTEVDAEFPEASVFFPEIDKTVWQETAREHREADDNNKYDFDFVTYDKR
jgi:dihydrofolate reductase